MKPKMNQVLWSLVLTASLIFMVGCNGLDDAEPIMEDSSDLMDIPATLKSIEDGLTDQNYPDARVKKPTYATFNAALGSSGLASVFARNELTVFAPTDAAFAELGLNPGNIRSVENLRDILLYHVVPGTVLSTDLEEGFVNMQLGLSAVISLEDGPMVNNANIIMTDKKARNGVIHGIDAVLLPANLAELLSYNNDFSLLYQAVGAAGLADAVASGTLTIFAPNNAAFVDLLGELKLGSLAEVLEAVGEDGLRDILLYHVVGGKVLAADLSNGEVESLLEETFTVDLSGPKLIDNKGRESFILNTDVIATNGAIHEISRVILP
ncbi:MAG TPA: fasciclin domain-containing protein [Anditalea sp.]|nr:fasciclin domain-containing protein [Anditalea sp.]